MLYKSYKQLYRIILNSKDATTKTTVNKTINTKAVAVITKYFFDLKIELPFTSQARLAVKSFYTNNTKSSSSSSSPVSIGTLRSPTISQRNTFQSTGTSKGVVLLSHNFNSALSTEYQNPDYRLNYIDIQNNLSWLTNGIELIVDSKILDDVGNDVGGFPDIDEWTLELIVYDDELEQNPAFQPFKPFENGYAPVY